MKPMAINIIRIMNNKKTVPFTLISLDHPYPIESFKLCSNFSYIENQIEKFNENNKFTIANPFPDACINTASVVSLFINSIEIQLHLKRLL